MGKAGMAVQKVVQSVQAALPLFSLRTTPVLFHGTHGMPRPAQEVVHIFTQLAVTPMVVETHQLCMELLI